MDWTEELIRSLHREHIENGVSLAAIGRRYGVSREAIRQKFDRYDLPRLAVGDHARRQRQAQERQAEASRERVIALYKERGSIDDVLTEVELPRDLVAAIVNTIPNREAYRRRGVQALYSRDDLIAAVRKAAKAMGEPLTVPNYAKAAKQLGLPSLNIIIQNFAGEDETGSWWHAALKAAGVRGNASRGGRRATTITEEDCVQAVVRYIQDNDGKRGSYMDYCQWAPEHDAPSGPTVRLRLPWNALVEIALDILAEA